MRRMSHPLSPSLSLSLSLPHCLPVCWCPSACLCTSSSPLSCVSLPVSVDLSLSCAVFLALLFFSLSLAIDFNVDHVKLGTCSDPALPHGSEDVDINGDVDEDEDKQSHGHGYFHGDSDKDSWELANCALSASKFVGELLRKRRRTQMPLRSGLQAQPNSTHNGSSDLHQTQPDTAEHSQKSNKDEIDHKDATKVAKRAGSSGKQLRMGTGWKRVRVSEREWKPIGLNGSVGFGFVNLDAFLQLPFGIARARGGGYGNRQGHGNGIEDGCELIHLTNFAHNCVNAHWLALCATKNTSLQ